MTITYKTNARAKRLSLRIVANNEVLVTMPKRISKDRAEAFVAEHMAWIKAQQAKLVSTPKLETNDWVYLFGKQYQKHCQYSRNRPIGCYVEDDQLFINPVDPQKTSAADQQTAVTRFLKHTAQQYLVPRTQQLADKMEITFGKVTLREQKTRWGSCSSKGNLNFNWRLVHFEPKVIDYVIIHELAHRVHMDHSAKFWHLVKQHDPSYPKHRGVLNRFGAQLH